jgi:hypothetical protein
MFYLSTGMHMIEICVPVIYPELKYSLLYEMMEILLERTQYLRHFSSISSTLSLSADKINRTVNKLFFLPFPDRR